MLTATRMSCLASPVVGDASDSVAMVLTVDTLPFSDSNLEGGTYASTDPGDHEGGSDSGPSVLEELPCEVCGSPDNSETMLLCDFCNRGTHTTCLEPPLSSVPAGTWLCSRCNCDSETEPKDASEVIDLTAPRLDITQDLPTLQHLKDYSFPPTASEQEKMRIRNKSVRYEYRGEQLYHRVADKPVPDMDDRPDIIATAHSYGHYGIDKTTNIVQNHWWWWGLKEHVKQHVKSCAPCKLGLAKFNEPVTMQPITVQGIYHKVGVDMIGPIQTSASGNKYIVTAIDYMSKNIEATAVPDKSSKTTAEFFYKDIICRHGTPVEVVTDQGGEFLGEFQTLLDKCGIDHRTTSAYHPQANGLTERANQTITRSLVRMTEADPLNWDKQIPTLLMGYQATKQASTKYAPFHMLYGHDMVLPINNKGRTVDAEIGERSESFLAEIFGPSATVLDKALENITYAQNKQMTDYAKRQLDGKAPENKSTSDAKHFSADKHCLASKPMKTAVNELCQPKSVANADANNATAPLPAPKTPLVTVKANTNDIPSSSKSVLLPPVSETLPSAPDSVAPTVTIKQETPAQPELRKRPHLPTFDIDDFVVMKVHKTARKEGDRKGKLVPKAEGPYLVQRFTDNTRRMAILADANGLTWTRRTAELSKWELD